MKIIVHKVHEKSAGGDYAEFDAWRESLLAEDPPNPKPENEGDAGAAHARKEMIRLLSILSS